MFNYVLNTHLSLVVNEVWYDEKLIYLMQMKIINELLGMRYGDMSVVNHSDSECLTNVTITVKHSDVS